MVGFAVRVITENFDGCYSNINDCGNKFSSPKQWKSWPLQVPFSRHFLEEEPNPLKPW